MIRRRVILLAAADASFMRILRFIAKSSSIEIAENYVKEIRRECQTLETFAERGTLRNDLPPGMRIIGYDRSATIAFRVVRDKVFIVNIFYRGINVAPKLRH